MPSRRRLVALGASVVVGAALTQVAPSTGASGAPTLTAAAPAAAGPSSGSTFDTPLGNGLSRLIAQEKSGSSAGVKVGPGNLRIDQSSLAIRDARGRVMIDLTPAAGVDAAAFARDAAKRGFDVAHTDDASGLMQGFASVDQIQSLAALPGLGTIAQTLKPITNVGATTSQGVPFQRVNKVLKEGVTGDGITVGILSDSYDTATQAVTGGPILTHAKQDIKTGDLPGANNPDGHTDPVVVIEDYDDETSTDEGRGMAQIVHDVAPDAKLCFATAFNGDVGFADNIRALADPDGPCKADVIVDDVSYFNEPFFSDGIIAQAVDEVEADGVSYFSSAGNSGDQNGWRSDVNLVSPEDVQDQADAAGLNFKKVDPSVYAGGIQDMKPGKGTDIAQTLAIGTAGGLYNLQWADPVDLDGPTLGEPYFSDTGKITEKNPDPSFTFTATEDQVGQQVLFRTDAIPSGTTDLILTVEDPDGNVIGEVDTGASPEVLSTTLQEAGDYTITITGFQGAKGDFTVDVSPVEEPSEVSTDFNVLVFSDSGKYLGELGDDNTLTGRPAELLSIPGLDGDYQFVIVNSTPGETEVPEIGFISRSGVQVKEYFDPLAPATFGHATADGASGVGAMDPFKPYVMEYYSSPGGELNFYFDDEGNPLPEPEVRQKPDLSSTDRGNTTFFVADDLRDDDDFPNFGGTSAAAPHAAAIAALLLSSEDGASLSPQQVENRLQRSAFKHDLNPFESSGKAGGITLTAAGAPGDERDVTPASMDDPGFFTLSYQGKKALKSITLYADTASPTALGAADDTSAPSAGLVWDPRPLADPTLYREGGYPFTVGGTGGGLDADSVDSSVSGKVAGKWYTDLKITFGDRLKKGQSLDFGIDRDIRFPGLATFPVEGNGADEMGGGVLLPQDKVLKNGLKFTAIRADGKKITGRVVNQIGKGWTALDGYGIVNAEKAVLGGK